MQINLLVSALNKLRSSFQTDYSDLVDHENTVAKYLDDRFNSWEILSQRRLYDEFPFNNEKQKFDTWKHKLLIEDVTQVSLDLALSDYVSFCNLNGLPANEFFWNKQFSALENVQKRYQIPITDYSITIDLFLTEWQKNLDKVRAQWEFETIQRLRDELYRELKEFLDVFRDLSEKLSDLELDTGWLFDLSNGNLTANDILQFQRWAKYLSEDEGTKQLCDLLGSLRQIQLSEKIERVKVSRTREVRLPDINSKEEIVGIRLGRDLEHALPSELALLSDPETALLFDLKFIEARLMCFDMRGVQRSIETYDVEVDQAVQEQEQLGPMIICVDTSGSMQGMPETIAKAVTLFMVRRAKDQKRDCFLINFSSNLSIIDLGHKFSMDTLIRFLSMSFHGGTDVAPALNHALKVMDTDNYKNADLLMISDFIMGHLDSDIHKKIEQRRGLGNRFYSLVINNSYMEKRMKTLFDHEWIFDPATSEIHELNHFHCKIPLAKALQPEFG